MFMTGETKSLITIITVCYNCENVIKSTVESVIRQKYNNIEYILVDGASTDTTIEIIKSYKTIAEDNGISFKFISEQDNGIYDAMNKGIALANGDYIHFLNAADLFCNDMVLCNVAALMDPENISLVIGGSIHVNNLHNIKALKYYRIKSAVSLYRNGNMVCHQSIFHNSKIFKKYGYYSVKYKLVADNEWLLRFLSLKNNLELISYVTIPIVFYDMTGVSASSREQVFLERKELLKDYNFGLFNYYQGFIINRIKYFKFLIIKLIKKLGLYDSYIKVKYK